MVTYRFIGTDFDVMLFTDASDNQKEFFITDITGLSAEEVQAGFDIGIEQHNEGQLAEFAMDQDIELYSYDADRNERCVVRQLAANPAGRFNGASSQLLFDPGFALASSGTLSLPIEIDMTVRFSEMDLLTISNEGRAFTIFSNDTTQDDYFALLAEIFEEDLSVNFSIDYNIGDESFAVNVLVPNVAERCLSIRMTITDIGGIYQGMLNVAGVESTNQTGQTSASMDTFVFSFGSTPDSASTPPDDFSDYFLGIMRNIEVSAAGTELINVVDPSTGVNSAGTNGVVTNIESVTTITS